MELKTGNWEPRAWRIGDEAALARYANNRKIWINLRDAFPNPYTIDDAVAWVQENKDRVPVLNFAVADRKEAIGAVVLTIGEHEYKRSAEIGYWLGEPFWGRGITHSGRACGCSRCFRGSQSSASSCPS